MPHFVPANQLQTGNFQVRTTPRTAYRGGTKLTFITCRAKGVKPFHGVLLGMQTGAGNHPGGGLASGSGKGGYYWLALITPG